MKYSLLVSAIIFSTLFSFCTKIELEVGEPQEPKETIDSLKIGLLAYYPFNGNAQDESGNGFNLTVNGASLTHDRFQQQEKAYHFDSRAFMQVPPLSTDTALRDITFSIWFKPAEITTNCLLSLNSEKYSNAHYLKITHSNNGIETWHGITPTYKPYTTASGTSIINDVIPDPTGKWSHIVVVQRYIENGGMDYYQYYQYFNGNKIRDRSNGSSFLVLPISFNYGGRVGDLMGNEWGSTFYKGDLDEIRIYNRVLSDKEVQQLYSRQP